MAHQVVPGLLLGPIEATEGDAEDAGGRHTVGASGQTHSVQRPVQGAGVQAELGAQCARGCQAGADPQEGILGGDHCHIWVLETDGHKKIS